MFWYRRIASRQGHHPARPDRRHCSRCCSRQVIHPPLSLRCLSQSTPLAHATYLFFLLLALRCLSQPIPLARVIFVVVVVIVVLLSHVVGLLLHGRRLSPRFRRVLLDHGTCGRRIERVWPPDRNGRGIHLVYRTQRYTWYEHNLLYCFYKNAQTAFCILLHAGRQQVCFVDVYLVCGIYIRVYAVILDCSSGLEDDVYSSPSRKKIKEQEKRPQT